MYINKTPRILLSLLLLLGAFASTLVLPSVQADTSGSATLSPAVISKIDAFVVKVQSLRPKYNSDADWNTFLDKLGSKVDALKPKYTGNALILAVLDRLGTGVDSLKTWNNNTMDISGTTTGSSPVSTGPYNCYGLGGLKQQYSTIDEIKQDAAALHFDHAINVNGTQVHPGFWPAVDCVSKDNMTKAPPSSSGLSAAVTGCPQNTQVTDLDFARDRGKNLFLTASSGQQAVIRFTPADITNLGLFQFSSSQDYLTNKTISLSYNACDFTHPIGYLTQGGPGATLGWSLNKPTRGYYELTPGTTYYLNVKNETSTEPWIDTCPVGMKCGFVFGLTY